MMEVMLIVGTYLVIFVGGFIGGMVTMATIMLRQLAKETDRYVKDLNKFMKDHGLNNPSSGDEWKHGLTDEDFNDLLKGDK